jgi:hypothetical protein
MGLFECVDRDISRVIQGKTIVIWLKTAQIIHFLVISLETTETNQKSMRQHDEIQSGRASSVTAA